MISRLLLSAAATLTLPFLATTPVRAAVILFEEGFESSPYVVGSAFPGGGANVPWTDSDASNGAAFIGIVAAKNPGDSQSVFFRDGSNRSITSLTTVPLRIDTTGFSKVVLHYQVAQTAGTTYETPDSFALQVNFGGGGLTTVFTDTAKAQGIGTAEAPEAYTGTPLTDPNLSTAAVDGLFYDYYIELDVSAVTWIQLKFITNGSSGGENFWLDNISVTGIPEPGAGMLLGLAALAGGIFRRRR